MLDVWFSSGVSFGNRAEPTGPVNLADGHGHSAPLFGTVAVIGAVACTAVVVFVLIVSLLSFASSESSGRTGRFYGESAPFSRARFGIARSFDGAMAASVRCMGSLPVWLSSRRARKRTERQQGARAHRLKWSVFGLFMVYTYCNTDNYPFGEVFQQMGWLTEVVDKRIYSDCSPSTRTPAADAIGFGMG